MENKLIHDSIEFLSSIVSYEEANIEKLVELKGKMLQFGFDSPFKPFLSLPSFDKEDMSEAEAQDVKKHLSYFRYKAFLKKSLLRQVQLSIAAHKLYKSLKIYGTTDILPFIPLKGNHVDLIMANGIESLIVYKNLKTLISNYTDEEIYYLVKLKTEKGIEKKKVKQLKELNGIVSSKRMVRSKKLISSTPIMISYLTAIATYTSSAIPEETNISDSLKSYNQTLKAHGILPFILIDRVDGFEHVKKDLVKKGFMLELRDDYILSPNIEEELKKVYRKRMTKLNEVATLLLLTPLLKFYLLKSRNQRELQPFVPSIEINPSQKQVAIFSALAKEEPNLNGIENVLEEKFQFEKLVSQQSMLSAALLKKYTSVSDDWIARLCSLDVSEVGKAHSWYSSIRGGRAERFLKEL